jgi:DNA-binding CsgD family transcriptional regulator
VSYSTDAIRVLTYPQMPKDPQVRALLVEQKLSQLLSRLRLAREASTPTAFQSGGQHYNVRLFKLNAGRNVSLTSPCHVLMLERRDRTRVDISSAALVFRLTAREQETLGFLIQGLTSKEIANHMGVSPHTVKAFLRLVMSKMQVSTRSGIVGKLLSTTVS